MRNLSTPGDTMESVFRELLDPLSSSDPGMAPVVNGLAKGWADDGLTVEDVKAFSIQDWIKGFGPTYDAQRAMKAVQQCIGWNFKERLVANGTVFRPCLRCNGDSCYPTVVENTCDPTCACCMQKPEWDKKTDLTLPGTRVMSCCGACYDDNSNFAICLPCWEEVVGEVIKAEERKEAQDDFYNQTGIDADCIAFMSAQDVIDCCIGVGVKFSDPCFTPHTEGGLELLRPAEIWENKSPVVFQDISPDDLVQGRVGDCWLISAISAVATAPHFIREALPTNEINPAGLYEVKLYRCGSQVSLKLDDRFPCKDGRPHSLTPTTSAELWPMLIEKAFARTFGGYAELNGGLMSNAFALLTGCPTFIAAHLERDDRMERLWPLLIEATTRANIVAVAIHARENPEDLNGLANKHGYTMLDARVIAGHRLVKLRNPWGHDGEWRGDWSDRSSCWTEEAKVEAKLHVLNDGIFWMPFEALRNIADVEICFLNGSQGSWNRMSVQSSASSIDNGGRIDFEESVFQLTIASEETDTWIGVSEENPFLCLWAHAAAKLHAFVTVYASDNAKISPVQYFDDFHEQPWSRFRLPVGEYMVEVSTSRIDTTESKRPFGITVCNDDQKSSFGAYSPDDKMGAMERMFAIQEEQRKIRAAKLANMSEEDLAYLNDNSRPSMGSS